MRTQLEEERNLVGGSGFWALQRECWTIAGNRNRAVLTIILMVFQQLTGVCGCFLVFLFREWISLTRSQTNAINYYAPTIFTNLGVTGNAQSLFATGVYGIVKMASCAIFITFLADTLGRKWSFIWTGLFMGFCMFYLGFYIRFDPPKAGAAIPGAGYAALVMVYLFAAAFQFGWGPCCWIYASEIASARLRGLNVSFAAATQWAFNLMVARVTPVMLVTVGAHGYGTYFFFGSFCFTMAVFAWFFVPETKGVSLCFSL